MKCLLFSLLTLSACVAGIYAVQCYSCFGAIEPVLANTWCNDPFDDTQAQSAIVSCPGKCMKSYVKIKEFNTEGYNRSCANEAEMPCTNSCNIFEGIEGCVYCCNGDKCNGATSVTFNLLAAAAMMVFAWAFAS